jgi:ankyrin repeat protein
MNQFAAAQVGDLEKLREVLTANNVDNADSRGWTALHNAAWYGHVSCVKYFVEMHANVNARNEYGLTPLHWAAENGSLDVVRVLLDAGASIDTTSEDGWTPLRYAIYYKRIEIVRLLFDRGAKLSLVLLDDILLRIPHWVKTFHTMATCGRACVLIMGIHKYRRSNVTANNDNNVLKLIAKLIWSTRGNDFVWK